MYFIHYQQYIRVQNCNFGYFVNFLPCRKISV
uniref:Uncharacterized protein n=1 Tax=Siphoviridae sp. ctvod4 TaxID=2827595 RepID=A0A8S5LKK0_9CAUD|nr:MAG TPA: hypothetical protein [Siphoviridae sp. ctvod4]